MQRKAGLWITGAFSTSPTGGIESLAGLIPVHLHLQKMAGRANFRAATLSDTHPLRSILSQVHHKGAQPHPCAISQMSEAFKRKVKGTVMEIDRHLPELTESFKPVASEARPGTRLMDRFPDQVIFNDCGSLLEQDALEAREHDLSTILRNVRLSDDTVYCSVDASRPDNMQHQAVSAAILYWELEELNRVRHVAGRVTAPDAELFAIRSAITLATQQDNCEKICIFTDSIASARRAVDPSLHSGQGHSLAVCRTLAAWLAEDSSCTITFVQVPSKLEWSIHKEAHDYAKGLISPAGHRPATSLDSVRKAVTKRAQESWTRMFKDPSYKCRNFLHLERLDGDALKPTYINGGAWLSPVGSNLLVAVRLFRCILNHAPIGSYYERFNIPEPLACDCGFHQQDRDHVLLSCNKHRRKANWRPHYLRDVVDFLEENPSAFSFRRPLGVG